MTRTIFRSFFVATVSFFALGCECSDSSDVCPCELDDGSPVACGATACMGDTRYMCLGDGELAAIGACTGGEDAGMDAGGRDDAGGEDAGAGEDAGMTDGGMTDGGMMDGGMTDGGFDAGRDAGMRDAGPTSCPTEYGFDPMRIEWTLPRPAEDPASAQTNLTWATFDINNDDLPDLVFIDLPAPGVGESLWVVHYNTGSGFGPAQDWTIPIPVPVLKQDTTARSHATFDLTGDGIPDLVVTDDAPADVGMSRWIVYPGGTNGFGAAMDWPIPRAVADISGANTGVNWETFDLTGDGRPDLVFTDDTATNVGTTRWLLYRNTGTGFAAAEDWTLPVAVDLPRLLAFDMEWDTVDYTNDGAPDLVFAEDDTMSNVGNTRWLVYPNTGSGFGASTDWSLPRPIDTFRLLSLEINVGVKDMNGDGWPDLVYTKDPMPNVGTTRWLVYFGGAGGFADTPVDWHLPRSAQDFSLDTFNITTFTMDMTGDGRPDFVFSNDSTAETGRDWWLVYPQCGGLI
jgi:hypothetical protein